MLVPSDAAQQQVLALEGPLANLPYFSPAPDESETAVHAEGGGEGDDGATAGSSTGRSDEARVSERDSSTNAVAVSTHKLRLSKNYQSAQMSVKIDRLDQYWCCWSLLEGKPPNMGLCNDGGAWPEDISFFLEIQPARFIFHAFLVNTVSICSINTGTQKLRSEGQRSRRRPV